MAGAEGFEPPQAVLETAGLPLNLRPCTGLSSTCCPTRTAGFFCGREAHYSVQHLATVPKSGSPKNYFTSRCSVCLRSLGLYFINSRRSVVFFLFFVVVYNFNFVSVHCSVIISRGIWGVPST